MRNALVQKLDESKVRLGRLKKIMSPNPPGNMIIPLSKKFPDWQEPMKEIFRLCGGEEREEFLKDCFAWVDETFDIDEDVYYKKDKLVRFAFGPMLESAMLVDPEEMMMDDPTDILLSEEEAALATELAQHHTGTASPSGGGGSDAKDEGLKG